MHPTVKRLSLLALAAAAALPGRAAAESPAPPSPPAAAPAEPPAEAKLEVVAESPFTLTAGVDLLSAYVWRGQSLNDEPVLQPSTTLAAYGFSANLWGSMDTTDNNGAKAGEFQEFDYTLSYTMAPVDGLSLTGGTVYYDLAGLEDTQELFVSAAVSALPLTPTFAVYYDVDEVEGFYASLGLSHTVVLDAAEKWSLGFGATLGWADRDYNAFYFGVDESKFNDLLLSTTLGYKITEKLAAAASVKYSVLVDHELRDAGDAVYGHGDLPVFGLNLSYSF